MSLLPSAIPVCKTYDSRIDINRERQYVITKGANKVSYIPYRSMSSGNSAFSFNIVPPSRGTFIDRRMYVESSITVVFSANLAVIEPANFTFVSPNEGAPRSFPLNRCLATITATIGNTSVSMQASDVVDCLLRCMKMDDVKYFNNGCPSLLDVSQTYDAFIAAQGLNVLGNFTSPICDDGYSRGYFNVNIGAMNRPAGAAGVGLYSQHVTFKVFEPVMLSPFIMSKVSHCSLIGLQNITLQYNFASGLAPLVWSGVKKSTEANPNMNVNVDVQFVPVSKEGILSETTDATLWVSFLTPSVLESIPPSPTFNFYEVQRYLTNGLVKTLYGESQTVSSNNIQLKVIPQMIIAGVRRLKSEQKYYHPDAYQSITSCAVNFANSVGILSTASPFNLYEISRKNGLNYPYSSWVGKYGSLNSVDNNVVSKKTPSGTGSLLVFKPDQDFGLSDGEASSLSGNFNFQISVTCECIDPLLIKTANPANQITANFELFVIIINDGVMTIDVGNTGSVSTNIGVITQTDVLTAPECKMSYNELHGMLGGDFLDTLKSYGKKALGMIHTIADVAPKLSAGLKTVGMGVGHGLGGVLVGGKAMSKKSLKDRLL